MVSSNFPVFSLFGVLVLFRLQISIRNLLLCYVGHGRVFPSSLRSFAPLQSCLFLHSGADTLSPHCVESSCKILARAGLVFMDRIDLWFLEMPLFPCRFHCIYLCLCLSVCARTHTNAWTHTHKKKTKLLDMACASLPSWGAAGGCCHLLSCHFPPVLHSSLHLVTSSAESRAPPLVISLQEVFLLLLSVLLCLFVSYSDSLGVTQSQLLSCSLCRSLGRSCLIRRKSVIIST